MSAPFRVSAVADLTNIPLLTGQDCGTLFRVPELFLQCVRAGWLSPCVRRGKLVLYARADVDRAIALIRDGALPPARERKPKTESSAAT